MIHLRAECYVWQCEVGVLRIRYLETLCVCAHVRVCVFILWAMVYAMARVLMSYTQC